MYFVLLAFLPFLYKLSFWLYVIQLKEYRFDRLKEYLFTPQWKKAVFNFWFYLEIIVFFESILFAMWKLDYKTMYYSLVFLLQFESLYVFYKIFTLKFPKPKFTKRMIILAWINLLTILIVFLEIFLIPNSALLIIPKFLVFLPVVVIFWNELTWIFFDKAKEKIFKKAEEKMKNINIKTIWITWSYGKSSTKEFLWKLLENKFNVIKTPKNINTEIWVSNFILKNLDNEIKKSKKEPIFIVEMWAYSKWEISRLWKIVNHQDAFLTWIWNQHIWLFGSQQNLIDAKCEIWEKVLENKWKLYLNSSNLNFDKNSFNLKDKIWIINFVWKTPSILSKLLENNQIVKYPEEFKITKIDENWTRFVFNNQEFETNIIWVGQIENLIWCIKYALNNWISLETIKQTIKNLKLPEKTMNIKIEKYEKPPLKYQITTIDDTYNLSVNGLINWVETIQYFKWKKLLILDDILELGKDSHQIHRKIWQYLANKIDEILLVWVNYTQDIINWLKQAWFKWKILQKPPHIVEDYVILLEWRKAGKYLS